MMLLVTLFLVLADQPEPVLALKSADEGTTLGLAITLQGRPVGADWDLFLDRLFAHADANGDGILSATEARRAVPVSLADGKIVTLDFQRADINKDAKISPEEFRGFYRQVGFLPISTVDRGPSGELLRLSAELESYLDRNGDGRISAAEWKEAPGLMRRFDENEDECLEPQELLISRSIDGAEARNVSSWSVQAKLRPDSILAIQLGDPPEAKLDQGPGTVFQTGSSPLMFAFPGARLRVKLDPVDPVKNFRSATRDFFLAQFGDAAGKKQALKKCDLEADPGLAAILALFEIADRNGDGVLTMAELEDFFDLMEMGLSRQVGLVLENRGRNLFDWLDDNGDGRLDIGELNRAAAWEPVERKDIPWSYRLHAARGPVENRFGMLRVPLGAKPAGTTPTASRGPDWFQAMDRNRDGFVSAAEFRGRPEAFARLDRDKDGRISVVEAQQTRK